MRDELLKLRIMHLVERAFPFRSGYTVRGKTIFESQKRAGLEPIVVSQYFDSNSVENMPDNWNQQQQHIRNGGIDYFFYRSDRSIVGRLVNVLFKLGHRGLRGSHYLARNLDEASRRDYVHNVCNMIKPKLIHAHTGSGQYAGWLSRKAGMPWVYEMRGFWEDSAAAEDEYSEQSKVYKEAYSQDTELAMAANSVIVISRPMREDLISRGIESKKICVVPNCVDASTFIPMRAKDPELLNMFGLDGKIVAGCITNIRRLEGLDTLINAIPLILSKVPKFCVVIVGDGSYKRDLEGLVEKLALTKYVRFTGRVPYDDVRRFYSVIDVLVIPRTNRRVSRLVTPLKPLEAMATEKAVLVSNVNGLTETVEDGRTGLVFEADDPDSLAEQCVRLCLDADLRERLGKEARRWVAKERSPHRMSHQYAHIYKQIMEKRGEQE